MKLETTQKLEELGSFPWLINAGQPMKGDYLRVQSWNEAVESSAAEVWSSVQLQVKNRLAREVRLASYERSQEWNGITAELRKGIADLMAKSIESIINRSSCAPTFEVLIAWDILMICLETEFCDLVPPQFFVPRLQPIYATGHFPCGWEGPKLNEGWEGQLPNWRLIVY